jgi:hypothetical protein
MPERRRTSAGRACARFNADGVAVMGTDEGDEPDLALVSTYVPVVFALARTTAAVACGEVLAFLGLHVAVRLVVFATVLYLDMTCVDAARLRGTDNMHRFERASGGLLVVTLVMFLRWEVQVDTPAGCGALAGLAVNALDALWAVCASTWCALACLGLHARLQPHVLVLVVGAFATGHVVVVCDVGAGSELLVRAYVYEALCAVMFFGRRYVLNLERNLYLRSVPFACAHVLLVSLYIVVPSVVITACLFGSLMYRQPKTPVADSVVRPKAVTKAVGKTGPVQDEHYMLAMQLKAAKESQGV